MFLEVVEMEGANLGKEGGKDMEKGKELIEGVEFVPLPKQKSP